MCGMQMVEGRWGVAAYGAASVKAVPDLVRVRFKVIRLEKTPAQSFARAIDSVHPMQEVLRGRGVPDGGVEQSRLRLKSAWSYTGSRREFLGYECRPRSRSSPVTSMTCSSCWWTWSKPRLSWCYSSTR